MKKQVKMPFKGLAECQIVELNNGSVMVRNDDSLLKNHDFLLKHADVIMKIGQRSQ